MLGVWHACADAPQLYSHSVLLFCFFVVGPVTGSLQLPVPSQRARERERERVCFRMCVRMSVMHLLGPFLSHAVLLVLLDWSSTATGARLQYSFGKKSNRSRQFHTSFHRPSVNADRIRAGVHRAFVVMQSVGLHRGALHAVRGACKLCNTRGKDQS